MAEDGLRSRFFKILKPSSWNLQRLTVPWRISRDNLSQLKEYQELTFLSKHETIRGNKKVYRHSGERNKHIAKKRHARSSPTAGDKMEAKRRQANTSIAGCNSTVQQDRIQQKIEEEMNKEIQTLASQLNRSKLEAIFVQLAKKNPGLIIDLLQDAPPNFTYGLHRDAPDWCVCGFCQEMPTDVQKVCCGKAQQHCISKSCAMANLCLNEAVLHLMLIYRNELFGLHSLPPQNYNRELRHAAYRQYILWQHGCLGNNGKRIPSCCVWAIRITFPDPNGEYSDFQQSTLS